MRGPLVVVGDALLDIDVVGTARRLSPDAPVPVVEDAVERARPGGAGLAALLAAQDGRDVVLVTALADDPAGHRLHELLVAHLRLVVLSYTGTTPVKQRVRADGMPVVRLDSGGDGVVGDPGADAAAAIRQAGAVLVADYGRGVTGRPALRRLLAEAAARVPVVWDPHPRGSDPVPGVRMATPNAAEAARACPGLAGQAGAGAPGGSAPLALAGAQARELARRWQAGAVAVTLGSRGALLSLGDGPPLVCPAPAVTALDACGAGDRFAATAAGVMLDGGLPSEAVTAAVAAASAFVAAGGAGAVDPAPGRVVRREAAEEVVRTAPEVVAATRAAGGTVVATGGCFDLLHAGHVRALRDARSLGDCLVVCLNSDASVRRLKGPERPLVPQEDRVRVLEALSCVDAVAVFEEDTPEAVLDRLRPDVWAKGGDYADVSMPEADLLACWGGQAVVLPYLAGRSTTRLVNAVRGDTAAEGER
jgi:D-beta-D-heptose 7-phosphate kinase/D-beta-D-heptose 1-phosphate adenosyltransferase